MRALILRNVVHVALAGAALWSSSCHSATSASLERSLTGQWRGSYLVATCTTTGWASCDLATADEAFERVGQSYDVTFQLTHSGADVSGTLTLTGGAFIAVSGRSNGTTHALSGHQLIFSTKSESQSIDVDWSGSLDDPGLRGTLTVKRTVEWGPANIDHAPGTATYAFVANVTNGARISP